MTQALPTDFINVSVADLNAAFNQGLDFTTPQQLRDYWKFYASTSASIDAHVAVRARNLFWRLLNTPKRAEECTNLQLSALWERCRRTEPLVLFSLPGRFRDLQSSSEDVSSSGVRSSAAELEEGSAETGNQPLLDRPSSLRADRRRSAEAPTSQEEQGPSPRTSVSTSSGNGSRPGIRRNPSSRSRTATVGRGRAKPNLPRRRSSQTRSSQATATQPTSRPAQRSPGTSEDAGPPSCSEPGVAPRQIPPSTGRATFQLPSAESWQDVEDASDQSAIASVATPVPRGSLVDRDFRKNFMSSGTNLSTLGRGRKTGSVVRFEDVPEVIGKGKGRESISSPLGGSPEDRRNLERSASQVISDSDESDEITMPRTQSNLSRLIKNVRKESGSGQLPPVKRSAEGQSEASRKKDDEILEMGRKAAAPVIPQGRPGSDIAQRMRSPSPGATF